MTAEELLAHAADFAFTPTGTTRATPRVYAFTVHVTWRSEGRWSIGWMGEVWNGHEFEYEPLPSSRDEAFEARCRFGFDEAVRIAAGLADTIQVNGSTWAQLREQYPPR